MQITPLGVGVKSGRGEAVAVRELQRKRKCGSCALRFVGFLACRVLCIQWLLQLLPLIQLPFFLASSPFLLCPCCYTCCTICTLAQVASRLRCCHTEVWQHCADSWQRNNKDKRCIVALRCGTKAKDRRHWQEGVWLAGKGWRLRVRGT